MCQVVNSKKESTRTEGVKIMNSPPNKPRQGFPGQNKGLIFETEAVQEVEHAQTAPLDQ